VVAQVDGLADGLEADACSPGRDRQQPEIDPSALTSTSYSTVSMCPSIDSTVASSWRARSCDAPGEHVATAQHLAQRHDHVPRLDGPGRRLRQERLVGHVRLGVDTVTDASRDRSFRCRPNAVYSRHTHRRR